MKLGPKYVYKCPKCANLLQNQSLMSGNAFGAKKFSDDMVIAPMWQEFPNLTKCKKCNHIFWLDKIKDIGSFYWENHEQSEWKSVDYAKFLTIDEYFSALELNVAENREEELFIRQRILWAFNDRVCDDADRWWIGKNRSATSDEELVGYLFDFELKNDDTWLSYFRWWHIFYYRWWNKDYRKTISRKLFNSKDDKTKWRSNVDGLIKILDIDDVNQKILLAELNRNIGNFRKCLIIIDSIENPEFDWIKDAFRKECKKKNKKVFQLY